ncbi:MAG: YggS family pyridoxal phosphate-dependent enzyme [Acidimicrobiia bacterium]
MGTRALNSITERMVAAASRAGRDPAGVSLLAVSKGRTNDEVRELYDAGQRLFGENRPQGLRDRIAADLPADIEWHFVGNVQRRAIKLIAPSIVLLHSFDRTRLVEPWASLEHPPPVLIEVNLAAEPQKHGFDPAEVHGAADLLVERGIPLRGLMIIPPRVDVAEDARRWFAGLRELGEAIRSAHPEATELSMGMTDDFEVAIEEGASIVRVGRAIFDTTDREISEGSSED